MSDLTKNKSDIVQRITEAYEGLIKVYNNREINKEKTSQVSFGFDDKVGYETGVQIQSAGMYSLLYIFDSFNEESSFDQGKFSQLIEIVSSTYKELDSLILNNGYNGAPYITFKDDEIGNWLGKDAGSYIGDVTWMLSLSLLIRKLHYRKEADFNLIIERVNHYIIECSNILVKSQISIDEQSGAWGFSSLSDTPTLYFSYIASASLSDLLDNLYDDVNQNVQTRKVDHEMINILNQIETENSTLLKDIESARKKLQYWFSKYVLPLVQDLSKCRKPKVSEALLEKAGIIPIQTETDINKRNLLGLEENEDFNYFYYALYAIDMYVMSRTDEFFEDIYTSSEMKDVRKQLLTFYTNNKLFNPIDIKYFEDNDNNDFIIKYLQQNMNNLHASYNRITRTGGNYWESAKAVYEIHLKYKDFDRQNDFDNALEDIKNLKDSVILPLFLKVNIQHCKWVTAESDKIVDNIIEDIIADRISIEDTLGVKAKQKHLDNEDYINLWDKVHFNLLITEKSIEGLIDYYEYKKHFGLIESQSTPIVAAYEPVVMSVQEDNLLTKGVKELISETMKSYLESQDFIDKINNQVEILVKDIPTSTKTGDVKADKKVKDIKKITKNLQSYDAFLADKEKYTEEHEYIELFKALLQSYFYQIIDNYKTQSDNAHKINPKEQSKEIMIDLTQIIRSLSEDMVGEIRTLQLNYGKLNKL